MHYRFMVNEYRKQRQQERQPQSSSGPDSSKCSLSLCKNTCSLRVQRTGSFWVQIHLVCGYKEQVVSVYKYR